MNAKRADRKSRSIIDSQTAEIIIQSERITQAPTAYLYINRDYLQSHAGALVMDMKNFDPYPSWRRRCTELGRHVAPWHWPEWGHTDHQWERKLMDIATYGFAASDAIDVTEVNSLLRLWWRTGAGVLTVAFEVPKRTAQEVCGSFANIAASRVQTNSQDVSADQLMKIDDLDIELDKVWDESLHGTTWKEGSED